MHINILTGTNRTWVTGLASPPLWPAASTSPSMGCGTLRTALQEWLQQRPAMRQEAEGRNEHRMEP